MITLFKKVCSKCHKKKFFVRKRAYYFEALKTDITSKGILCGECYKAIKKVLQ